MKIGETYDFLMKPTFMRGWKYVRETKKCYAIIKKGHAETLIPKKQVIETYKKEDDNFNEDVTTGVKQENHSKTEGFIKAIILI